MTDDLERAARALYAKRGETRTDWKPWEDISSTAQHILREEVRAVLQALREPSEQMMLAAYSDYEPYETPHADDAWRTMVDEIITDRRTRDYIKVQS